MHNYPGPDCPELDPRRAAVLGEFGGLGLIVPGHIWSTNYWGYVMLTNRDDLADRYTRMLKQVWRLHSSRGLNAAVYTQTADVETECNGLQTYDRAAAKIAPSVLLAANRGDFWDKKVTVTVADGLYGHTAWRYATNQPPDDWFARGFNESKWSEGISGFGTAGTPALCLNTTWNTSDIWLRRDFDLRAENIPGIELQVFHDEDVEVYLNGVLALKLPGYITDYDEFPISNEALATLHPGQNIIAVHCHQTVGGQGVDVGIVTPE
jgi:hypothetical protein